MADDDAQAALDSLMYRGITPLGHGIDIGPTGGSTLPAGAPTGLPAPSGVGGVSGFMGGGRGGGASVRGPGQDLTGQATGLIKKALGKASEGTPTEPTRGDTGGVSLSDRLRSVQDVQGLEAVTGLTGLSQADLDVVRGMFGGTGTMNLSQEAAEALGGPGAVGAQFNLGGSLGEVLRDPFSMSNVPYVPPGAVTTPVSGATEGGLTAIPGTAEAVAPSALSGLAAGATGMLVGAAPGIIASQLGASPEAQAGAQIAGTIAAPAAAGAVSGAAAGTGVAAGAAAGLAAAAPALIASAPIAAGMIMQGILSARDTGKAARDLKIRVQNIGQQLPHEVEVLMEAPQIAEQLNANSTPEQAAGILKQLNDLQKQYQEGGWESYEKGGGTTVQGGTAGKDLTAMLPGVQSELRSVMNQIGGTMNVARIRAQDLLQKAGWTPEQIQKETGRYITPIEAAQDIGSSEFGAALRPQAVQGGVGDLQRQISEGTLDPNAQAAIPAESLKALGLDPNGTYTNQDLANYFGQAGAGTTQGLITSTPYGDLTTALMKEVEAIQPGSMESGLATLLGQYGAINPLMARAGFGQGFPAPVASPAQTEAAQRALNTLGVSGGITPTGGVTTDEAHSGITGELSDEQKRLMGVQ